MQFLISSWCGFSTSLVSYVLRKREDGIREGGGNEGQVTVSVVAARSPARLLASRHFVHPQLFRFAPRLFPPRGTNWNYGLGPNRARVKVAGDGSSAWYLTQGPSIPAWNRLLVVPQTRVRVQLDGAYKERRISTKKRPSARKG